MTTEFNTTDYQMSHGRGPRGFGSWAFFFQRNADVGQAFWVHQSTYADAKKAVRAEVKRRQAAGEMAAYVTAYVGS